MARLPLFRRLYSETFFGGFDMRRFDLIGRHEEREQALSKLSQAIAVPLQIATRDNVTPQTSERVELLSNRRILSELETILIDDLRFYDAHARV